MEFRSGAMVGVPVEEEQRGKRRVMRGLDRKWKSMVEDVGLGVVGGV
jgi:hypothetical protein